MAEQVLLTGHWDDNQAWELIQSDTMPDARLCTAVYCLAILANTNEVVLTRNRRGWEMLGGHIEPDETVEQALVRECLEEGGFIPESYRLFGYRKVTAKQPVPHSQRAGIFYPFPHGYIPHLIATSTLPMRQPSGIEILEHRVFALEELETLGMEQWPIIKAMLPFLH